MFAQPIVCNKPQCPPILMVRLTTMMNLAMMGRTLGRICYDCLGLSMCKPFSFWPKLSEKILGMFMVVGLFGKALLELRPKAERVVPRLRKLEYSTLMQ